MIASVRSPGFDCQIDHTSSWLPPLSRDETQMLSTRLSNDAYSGERNGCQRSVGFGPADVPCNAGAITVGVSDEIKRSTMNQPSTTVPSTSERRIVKSPG